MGHAPATNQLDKSTGMADSNCSTEGLYRACGPSAYFKPGNLDKHWVSPLSVSLKQKYESDNYKYKVLTETETGETPDEMKMYNIVVNVHCTLPVDRGFPKVYARMQYFFRENRARVHTITSAPLKPCGKHTLSATFAGEDVKKMLAVTWVELFLDDRDDPSGDGVCAVGETGQDQLCESPDGRCNGDGWQVTDGGSICPNTSCFDSSRNYCMAGPRAGGGEDRFYESSATEALLVEAVTITREHKDIPPCTVPSIEDGGSLTNRKGDDRDADRNVFLGQMVPFALYAPKAEIDPSCGVRNENMKMLSTRRPTNAIFRMGVVRSAQESTRVANDQTRVFRASLTLKGDSAKYPDKLRMCFFAHSDGEHFNAAAILKTMRPQFTASTQHLAKRVCCVDIDLVKSIPTLRDNSHVKGNGQIVNFHVALQATPNDSVKMIVFNDGNRGGSLEDSSLQLTSLYGYQTNSTAKNIEQSFLYNEEIELLGRNGARQLCETIRPIAPVRKGSVVLDLEYLRDTNARKTKTLAVPGIIASGRGILVSGQLICETSNPTQELVSTTIVMGQHTLALSLTRTGLMVTLGSAGGAQNVVKTLKTPNKQSIRAATEVMYACALFRDGGKGIDGGAGADTVMLMLSAGEAIVRPMSVSLTAWPKTLHYPPITNVLYAPSPDARILSAHVATSLVKMPSAELMQDRMQQFTQRRDVRAFASPILYSRGSYWGSATTPLTEAVNLRHMSFTLVLHTWLLKNTHYVTNGCKSAGWGYPPVAFQQTADGKRELVIADWGGMQVVLQLTERSDPCKHSNRVLLLRPHRGVNKGDIRLVDSSYINAHHTQDSDTMGMLQILFTHTGEPSTGHAGTYRGHVCVRLTNTWGWNWGVRAAKKLHSSEYNVQSTVCSHVELNTFCTVYCVVDGYALPLDCDGAATNINYPHDNYTKLEDETTALTRAWFNRVRSVTIGPEADQVNLRVERENLS